MAHFGSQHFWFVVLALAIMSAGCSKEAGPLVPVAGKVIFRGTTLSHGTIVFSPDTARGQRGPIAIGQIASDGTYQLTTGNAPGAGPGWYRVTVTCLASGAPSSSGQRYPVPDSLVPDKYGDPELSQLIFEVKKQRANTIDIILD